MVRPSSILYSVLIAGLFFVTIFGIINSLSAPENYDVTVNSTYYNTFDEINNISTEINTDYEVVFGNLDDNKTGWYADVTSFLGLTVHATSLVKNMLVTPILVIEGFTEALFGWIGLPPTITAFFKTIMMAAIIFALIALILRYRYT